MRRILDKQSASINNSSSPLSFETTGGDVWKIWDRFIAVSGQNIYHIGNVCGTCSFFFEKLADSNNIAIPETIDQLHTGIETIDESTLDVLQRILPAGKYEIVLLRIKPRITSLGNESDYFTKEQVELWGIDGYTGVPHSPKADYYRGTDKILGNERKLFEFFIPMTSFKAIDEVRVDFYKEAILKGGAPTAISLTVLDIKEPAIWPDDTTPREITSHWCLGHYIIDGHHKMKAASDLNSDLTLLAFISYQNGISTHEELGELLKSLG